MLVVGNYQGFNINRLTDSGEPEHLSSIVCPGDRSPGATRRREFVRGLAGDRIRRTAIETEPLIARPLLLMTKA